MKQKDISREYLTPPPYGHMKAAGKSYNSITCISENRNGKSGMTEIMPLT